MSTDMMKMMMMRVSFKRRKRGFYTLEAGESYVCQCAS